MGRRDRWRFAGARVSALGFLGNKGKKLGEEGDPGPDPIRCGLDRPESKVCPLQFGPDPGPTHFGLLGWAWPEAH
ncbi:hypothetical protein CDL15_Pgr021227 [Punica granatum]|nr:hypothetical protein CDL15_Pgr021227 [Punica granatum]